jgi:hypothetical protein
VHILRRLCVLMSEAKERSICAGALLRGCWIVLAGHSDCVKLNSAQCWRFALGMRVVCWSAAAWLLHGLMCEAKECSAGTRELYQSGFRWSLELQVQQHCTSMQCLLARGCLLVLAGQSDVGRISASICFCL